MRDWLGWTERGGRKSAGAAAAAWGGRMGGCGVADGSIVRVNGRACRASSSKMPAPRRAPGARSLCVDWIQARCIGLYRCGATGVGLVHEHCTGLY